MNQTDREELNKCRRNMMKMFLAVCNTPEDDPEIRVFLEANERHQEILAGDARKERGE